MCGHATLATAHVLFNHGYAGESEIIFRDHGGILTVTRKGDLLAMDFPALPPERIEDDPRVEDGLGAKPVELHEATNLLAVFDDQRQIPLLLNGSSSGTRNVCLLWTNATRGNFM